MEKLEAIIRAKNEELTKLAEQAKASGNLDQAIYYYKQNEGVYYCLLKLMDVKLDELQNG